MYIFWKEIICYAYVMAKCNTNNILKHFCFKRRSLFKSLQNLTKGIFYLHYRFCGTILMQRGEYLQQSSNQGTGAAM